jgi:hypothetical protein
MDHDRLFKELLTTFFTEFLQLSFPARWGFPAVGQLARIRA